MPERRTSTVGPSVQASGPSPLRVVVVAGPDAGLAVEALDGTVLVGTHADCQLRLTDSSVSRRHCALELLAGKVRVRDLDSKNGTRYLGARLSVAEVPLGATLELGAGSALALTPPVRPGVVSERTELAGLVGRSLSMRRLFAAIEHVAPTDASVLIQGETGTGKEAVARALHRLSPRADRPFITVDCGATSGALLQSVLFGHVRGAFTGAVKDTVGLVEAAHGGVLFLDEVASLPMELQPVLLRVLESGTFQRLGESRPRSSDFRLLAATTRPLDELVRAGAFRSDVYYRLAAIVLEVPPLRSRLDDVAPLAQAFAEEVRPGTVLPPSALAGLLGHQWPGNVRELRNAVERVVTLGHGGPGDGGAQRDDDFHASREKALAAFEKSYLEALLLRHKGSASAAAREAGIARSYLYRLLEAHRLDPERFRG